MTVVLDSNVVVALVLDDERAKTIEPKMREWEDAGEVLHAPALFRYEVANALTRNIVADRIDSADAKAAWQRVLAIAITFHSLERRRRSALGRRPAPPRAAPPPWLQPP